MKNKKGVAAIATFSFIIILLILVFVFSYSYYKTSRDNFSIEIKKEELQNSMLNLRSNLLDLANYPNSTLIYQEKYLEEDITFYLILNKTISGEIIYGGEYFYKNISFFGPNFCSNFNMSPKTKSNFHYNGTCINVSSIN